MAALIQRYPQRVAQRQEGEHRDHRRSRFARPRDFINVKDQRGEDREHDHQKRERDVALFDVDEAVDAPHGEAEENGRKPKNVLPPMLQAGARTSEAEAGAAGEKEDEEDPGFGVVEQVAEA